MRKAALALCAALSGCAAPPPASFTPSIPMEVLRPEGDGPFPAVVILHDCSGLGPRSSHSPARWGKELQSRGYVVVIPDSFTTRGHADGVCTDPSPSRLEVAPSRRVRDAYEALDYARSLPYVDGAHVGVMGGSHGGSSTLATIAAQRAPEAPRFTASVALYPGCGARYGDWHADGSGTFRANAPLLILVGEKDDWTPAEPCRRLAERAREAGYPVSVKIYPGALHSFDSASPVRYVATRVNANAPGGRGATTGGNSEAWADSIREVTGFFARHLKNSPG